MNQPFVNMMLLIAATLLFITGIVMLYGTWFPWVFTVHRVSGFAALCLIPWKGRIVYASLKRRVIGRERWLSTLPPMAMAVVSILVAALGLMWMWNVGPYQAAMGQTVVAWHWILGLAILPLFLTHVSTRWPQPRLGNFASRRSALKLLAVGGAGLLGWLLGVALARARADDERPRRSMTGSRGFGQYTGNAFPVTGEPTLQVNREQWRLSIDGAVSKPLTLTYREILSMASERMTQTIDCTSGWFSTQEWSGVPLVRLLAEVGGSGAVGVRLVSATGYHHTYAMPEARTILLATGVGGDVLAPRHGYPLRAVVPDRRGWFWVKWLVRVEVLDSHAEVLGGILSAARQVLRQM